MPSKKLLELCPVCGGGGVIEPKAADGSRPAHMCQIGCQMRFVIETGLTVGQVERLVRREGLRVGDPGVLPRTKDDDLHDAVARIRDRMTIRLGVDDPTPIMDVVNGNCGWAEDFRLTQQELRIIRYALNRALEEL